MSRILTETPIWVWPLFILLLIVGLRARRMRQVPIVAFYALPLLGISAVTSVAGLGAGALIWGLFGLCYLLGAVLGYRVQQHWVLGRTGRMVKLAGESLTLSMMMLVFGANFVGGFLQAAAPDIYTSAAFAACFAAILAASSGSFAGRALRVGRYRDPAGEPV